ncbi:hypothetical protein [Shewanella sp. Isolate11]|uniref:hypothetical protein n=1 Tax=Shewanella sp. Isolate11 TaxID=2908530 RepID=UPI001EFDB893|nr:hypothetical protein [Shewanella sp. Isolate11]MCG9697456.1 hypothetical protein [Shewanella sp. Isolate11]
MNNASLVNQSSAEAGFEYYTPAVWIEAARTLMGKIDLDPASCETANQTVKAETIYDKNLNGLTMPWYGRVWMNHPFHRGEAPCPSDHSKCKKKACKQRGYHITTPIPGNADWINKLLQEYMAGRVTEAVCITFCNSSEAWFKPLLQWPQCFPHGRVHYIGQDGQRVKGCTKGSVITYIGKRTDEFAKAFADLGTIKVPYKEAV